MHKAELVHITHFMPERIINNEEFYQQLIASGTQELNKDELKDHHFFRGVLERRFASPEYSSADLGSLVLKKLLTETGFGAEQLDLIIYSCILSDNFWPNVGSTIQYRCGAKHASIMHVDTSCASFLTALNTAQAYIAAGIYKSVAVLSITNFISRLPEFQKKLRSFVLGDGAIAALLVNSKKSSIMASFERSFGENYGLMKFEPEQNAGQVSNYWERDSGPITVNFSFDQLEKIRENALRIVPFAINEVLSRAKLSIENINLLITHQPNEIFLTAWRQQLDVKPAQVFDTLAMYGNLFQGSVAVTLAEAVAQKKIKANDVIALGAFSNGGDFVSSMLIKY